MKDIITKYNSVLLKKRIIYLTDVLEQDDAIMTGQVLTYLNAVSNEPIYLHIDSPGSELITGLQIYDFIKASAAPVIGTVMRRARSMAAIILQACKSRRAYRHSIIQLHHFDVGKLTIDEFYPDVLDKTIKWVQERSFQEQELIYNIVANACKIPINEAKKLFGRGLDGRIFSAEEAKTCGLIDEIINK